MQRLKLAKRRWPQTWSGTTSDLWLFKCSVIVLGKQLLLGAVHSFWPSPIPGASGDPVLKAQGTLGRTPLKCTALGSLLMACGRQLFTCSIDKAEMARLPHISLCNNQLCLFQGNTFPKSDVAQINLILKAQFQK